MLAILTNEKLKIDHWRGKESTRDAVRVTIRDFLWSDEIRQGTGIVSNKAFERYFQHAFEDELKIYQKRNELRKGDKKMAKVLPSAENGKILNFQ
ncbi:MAG: hypothetical protein ACOWYE_13795 [Desulfatiglandales bacterium]